MLWSNSSRRRSTSIAGYIEHVDHKTIRGWAWNARRPRERLSLDVFIGGLYAGRARTGRFRDDLRRNRIGDGHHAFLFHVPSALSRSTITLNDVEILADGKPPTLLGTVDVRGIGKRVQILSSQPDAATFFRTLVEHLVLFPQLIQREKAGDRRQLDQMLAPVKEHDVSDFLGHIARKYGLREPNSDESFWDWYLECYGIEKGPARVPLSASDIGFLLARCSDGKTSRRFGFLLNKTGRAYEWAVDRARRLYVEDCLVPPSDRARLCRVPRLERSTAFPLSTFMRRFRASCDLIQAHEASSIDGRINIYALIMLFSLMEVHFLAYMPIHWIKEMLASTGKRSLFESAQETLLGSSVVMKPEEFCRHIEAQGFDLDRQAFDGTSYRGNRVCHGDRITEQVDQVDIQLIGPFRRRLGLAESCRRLAVALQSTGRSLNLCDFDIGVASAVADPSLPIGEPRSARINILHVNAEEVPEVIAYLPDCFSRSHTILVPYWELDRPAAVHGLGLSLVDEIWVTTTHLANVFSGAGKPVTKIGMSSDDRPAGSRQEGRALMARLGVPADRFVFLTTSDALSWAQRKNALGTMKAFQAAFSSSEAVLVVKTRHSSTQLSKPQREHWDEIRARSLDDPRIVLVDADLSDRQQRDLLAGCDCFVSLHRAEGLGLDILDSLARGTPVVATAYSGNMDFCDHNTSWPIDYALVGVNAEDYAFAEPGHMWAEPDMASAVAALRNVLNDKNERIARARFAAERTRLKASLSGFAARLTVEIDKRLGPPCQDRPYLKEASMLPGEKVA